MNTQVKDWNIQAITGYKPISTFYTDLGIAEPFGLKAVEDTFNRCLEEWKSDYKMLTELVMAVNWKSWEHSDDGFASGPLCNLYIKLFRKGDAFARKHLKGEELSYYYATTD